MKNKIGRLFSGLILIFLPFSQIFSQSGMAFLNIGNGARAVGMAEAFTALANDPSATYWNPAGLVTLQNTQMTFSHNSWIQDVQHEFFAIAFKTGQNHLGLSFTSNNIDGIERRVKPTEEPIGTVQAHDLAVGLSYARGISRGLHAGITLKYVYERIYYESAPGFAVDLGLIYQPAMLEGLSLGLVTQNLGFTSKLKNESIELPKTLKAGLAYKLLNGKAGSDLTGALDVVQYIDADLHVNMGLEWLYKNLLALRAGYQTGWDEKGLHAGVGFGISRFLLDYAYTPFTAELGTAHRFSITFKL
ncbi:PorV/PorQ family protein [candidate division KSB1 bacterium]|nr:PorV/PorQ family protein [candidate division KSB1 bacterium]